MVENDAGRFLLHRAWHSEVDVAGVEIAEIVDSSGRLMRNDADALTPYGPSCERVISVRRPLRQTEKCSIHAYPVSAVGVVFLSLVAEPNGSSLGCGEVAGLSEGDLVEPAAQV